MENKNIEIHLRGLDWNSTQSVQESAIQDVLAMVKTGQLNAKDLIHATYEKKYWENSARVLLLLPQEYINGYEELLFDAIQDSNWPGTELLIELLSRQPLSNISELYRRAYENATLEEDDCWVHSLDLLTDKISQKS